MLLPQVARNCGARQRCRTMTSHLQQGHRGATCSLWWKLRGHTQRPRSSSHAEPNPDRVSPCLSEIVIDIVCRRGSNRRSGDRRWRAAQQKNSPPLVTNKIQAALHTADAALRASAGRVRRQSMVEHPLRSDSRGSDPVILLPFAMPTQPTGPRR